MPFHQAGQEVICADVVVFVSTDFQIHSQRLDDRVMAESESFDHL
jgi:hypothetical protein